ncbi:hypothetical protein GIB67_006911 [Kingdonia uniflora]|uniref:Transcription factor CBF/NF-Y/archaeal histone domain-containing protein n=1 Tax=Kingdonia uniflora TaxID=39325 RepID=A0A7J7L091_9MAGN|nr:hypothetical protein GIB67_006911 [Kingdonia uniflora]
MADNFRFGGSSSSNVDFDEQGGCTKEQDRLVPIANVGRIMKQILPSNAKISKEAKETMQESVSEFISFVTSEASDKCQKEKRKTVNGDDICWAMGSLGFDDFAKPLKRYLHKYRELEGEKATQNKAITADDEDKEGASILRREDGQLENDSLAFTPLSLSFGTNISNSRLF